MNAKKLFFSLFLSISLLAGGCSRIPTNANTAFRNFTLNLFREDVSSTTLGLHYTLLEPESFGISETITTLGTFETNPASSLVFFENCEAALDKFSYDTLSKENQLTHDILSSYINIEKKGADFCLYAEPLSPVTGIHVQLPILLSEYTLHSEKEVLTYLDLLKTVPDYFSSLLQYERTKSAAGLFMADNVLENVLEQCNAFLEMGNQNYLHTSFIERLSTISDIPEENRIHYISEHQSIIQKYIYPSYSALINGLEQLQGTGKNERGICYYPNGKDYFSYLLASETGSSKSVPEIKNRIESQIADDLLQMAAMESPVSSNFETGYTTPLGILRELKDNISNAFPAAKPVSVEIKYVPSALEEHLSPAFYFIPAIDNMEENIIYINQGYTMNDLDLFSTLAHEGYPGHLYQTTYFAATNPDPIRHLFSFKGYVEGWATYAEMCSYYISPLDKTSATYSQKNNSLLLGLYAMADLGIHYEGWSLKETCDFFATYGIYEQKVISDIYDYILGDPVNYLAYYVGYLEILDLKKSSQLTQIDFHKKLLEIGPAPFSVVEKWMSR